MTMIILVIIKVFNNGDNSLINKGKPFDDNVDNPCNNDENNPSNDELLIILVVPMVFRVMIMTIII